MRLASAASSDVGQVRTLNEDSVLVVGQVMAVADGMGGHRGGEVASRLAVETLEKFVGPLLDDLVAGVRAANTRVFEHSLRNPSLAGMGTTLCALGPVADEPERDAVGIVNVGDSRVYLLTGGELHQISEDHSFVETLVRDGRLTREQAEVHPQRNVLTRALGIEAVVAVDAWSVDVTTGDRFLLCSDGLFNEVPEAAIAEVLATVDDPQAAADDLVARANAGGGRDNISCVIVDIDDAPPNDAPLGARIRRRVDPTANTLAPELETAMDAADPLPPTDSTSVERKARRLTWRATVFVLAIVATLAAGVGSVAWFARNTWWVKADRGEVTIFQGPPDGLLWIDAISKGQKILVADIADEGLRKDVERGIEYDSLESAQSYVDDLARQVTTSTVTSTTTSTTTSSPTATSAAAPTEPAQTEPAPTGAGATPPSGPGA